MGSTTVCVVRVWCGRSIRAEGTRGGGIEPGQLFVAAGSIRSQSRRVLRGRAELLGCGFMPVREPASKGECGLIIVILRCAGLLGCLEIVAERHGGLMIICKALSVTVIASLLMRFSCAAGLGAGPCARGRVRVVRGHVTWFPVGCWWDAVGVFGGCLVAAGC